MKLPPRMLAQPKSLSKIDMDGLAHARGRTGRN